MSPDSVIVRDPDHGRQSVSLRVQRLFRRFHATVQTSVGDFARFAGLVGGRELPNTNSYITHLDAYTIWPQY